jgi:hypothetical protein
MSETESYNPPMFEMPGDIFSALFAKQYCGIYHLMREGRVVYVGQSVHIISRLTQHIADDSKLFDGVRFRLVPQEFLRREESIDIWKYNPEMNKTTGVLPGWISASVAKHQLSIYGSIGLDALGCIESIEITGTKYYRLEEVNKEALRLLRVTYESNESFPALNPSRTIADIPPEDTTRLNRDDNAEATGGGQYELFE